MQREAGRCSQCGGTSGGSRGDRSRPKGVCADCGAPLDAPGLPEFAKRLARFGLGSTDAPLLKGLPELPDAK